MTPPDLSCPSCGCPVAPPSALQEPAYPLTGPAAPLTLPPPAKGRLTPVLCVLDRTATWCDTHAVPWTVCQAVREGGR